jgi:hypothetical protein
MKRRNELDGLTYGRGDGAQELSSSRSYPIEVVTSWP